MQMGKIYIGDVCKEYKGQLIDLFIARFPRSFLQFQFTMFLQEEDCYTVSLTSSHIIRENAPWGRLKEGSEHGT